MEEISKTVSNCMNGLIPAGSQELEDGDYIGQDGLGVLRKMQYTEAEKVNLTSWHIQ